MAEDYSGLDEAALNEKLQEASDYEKRSAIRKALRQLKKDQGRTVGSVHRKRAATYNRFAGTTATTNKAVTPKSFIGKEKGGEESPARQTTPSQTPPIRSPVPTSPPPSYTPPPTHTPSPLETRQDPPRSPSPPPATGDETDGIPPHTEEPSPPLSPEPPRSPTPPPRSPTPPPRSPTPPPPQKFHEEEEIDAADEGVEPDEEEAEPGEQEVEPDEEEAEPDEQEAEPDNEEVEPDEQEAEPDEEEKEEEEPAEDVEEDTAAVEQAEEEEEDKPHPPEVKPRPQVDKPARSVTTDESADIVDGSPFGKRLRARRPEGQTSSPREKEGGAKVEFQGFKLRKTLSQEQQEMSRGGSHDFGVKLKARESRPTPSTTDAIPSRTEQASSPPRSRAKTFGSGRQTAASSSSSSSGPRTLRDYQQLSARSQRSKVESPDEDDEGGSTLPVDELQRYLVMYVNQELSLSPPIPSRGKALYDVCSDTTNLCKLINKSVRNTVDLRALSTISPSMPASEREEAIQDNMTLTTESARAIGCQVTDSTGDRIIRKDPPTIRGFLVDLIRARVVNMPGMEDEPTKTFTNLSVLFSKLGISEVDGEGEGGEGEEEEADKGEITWREKDSESLAQALKTPPNSPPTSRSWREKPASPTPRETDKPLSYEERAAMRRAEREKREQERDAKGGSKGETVELSYGERAAMRKAERERRRRERAELAGSH